MDFQGVDLRSVLRTFAEISGLNMVIDPDVQGTVDIVLNEVPWDQALEVILRGNQLDYTVDGTIVRIAKIDTLKKEQEQLSRLNCLLTKLKFKWLQIMFYIQEELNMLQ